MPVLRSIEAKIESLFEGVFGRAFRTHVQPIELARKLVKEMDDHKSVSVSRVYVPNEYSIYLSPDDRKQFAGYEESLVAELQEYLAEHARRERYAVLSPPRVLVETDDDLAIGEFGIATRLVADETSAEAPPPPELPVEAPAQTMIYRAPPPVDDEAPPPEPVREVVSLTVRGPNAGDHEGASRPRALARRGRPRLGRQRVPPPRRASPGGCDLLDRRPRVDQRHRAERQARRPRATARRRPNHPRLDGDRVRAVDPALVMTTEIALSPTRRF